LLAQMLQPETCSQFLRQQRQVRIELSDIVLSHAKDHTQERISSESLFRIAFQGFTDLSEEVFAIHPAPGIGSKELFKLIEDHANRRRLAVLVRILATLRDELVKRHVHVRWRHVDAGAYECIQHEDVGVSSDL